MVEVIVKKYNPKILFLTIPLREEPTEFPPYGVLSVMQYLRNGGYDDLHLLNQDFVRYPNEKIIEHIDELKPDIIGISAVVSTGYGYVKGLSLEIKDHFKDIPIIVGGPLGASADVILKKTGVDIVCISEGEIVMSDLLSIQFDSLKLKSIKGIVFRDQNEELINTGYGQQLDADLVYEVDYQILNRNEGELNHYFPKISPKLLESPTFIHYFSQASWWENSSEYRMVSLPGSKGCVAKCTFCHRWDKGIRYLPIDKIVNRIEGLIKNYNVRLISMSDENFGTDKKWLKEFCEKIKKLDCFWYVGGMRVNCIDQESIQLMKEAGCFRTIFGMETGSARMLKIMNKGVKIEDNYNALKLIYDNKMLTSVQLVLGMPGENWETVEETCDFLKFSVAQSEEISPFDYSINYAQALPGTPLYEYARHKSLIINEENYLLWVSNKNASDDIYHMYGLSGFPKLVVLSWRPYLMANVFAHYIKLYGKSKYNRFLTEKFLPSVLGQGYFTEPKEQPIKLGDFSIKMNFMQKLRLQLYIFPKLYSKSRFILYLYTLLRITIKEGPKESFMMLFEYLKFKTRDMFRTTIDTKYQSLRKTMFELTNDYETEPSHMRPLRKGRW